MKKALVAFGLSVALMVAGCTGAKSGESNDLAAGELVTLETYVTGGHPGQVLLASADQELKDGLKSLSIKPESLTEVQTVCKCSPEILGFGTAPQGEESMKPTPERVTFSGLKYTAQTVKRLDDSHVEIVVKATDKGYQEFGIPMATFKRGSKVQVKVVTTEGKVLAEKSISVQKSK